MKRVRVDQFGFNNYKQRLVKSAPSARVRIWIEGRFARVGYGAP